SPSVGIRPPPRCLPSVLALTGFCWLLPPPPTSTPLCVLPEPKRLPAPPSLSSCLEVSACPVPSSCFLQIFGFPPSPVLFGLCVSGCQRLPVTFHPLRAPLLPPFPLLLLLSPFSLFFLHLSFSPGPLGFSYCLTNPVSPSLSPSRSSGLHPHFFLS
ncbi:hypothetical protein H1C71_039153, partial [Ictidomys tridecemlineatus]